GYFPIMLPGGGGDTPYDRLMQKQLRIIKDCIKQIYNIDANNFQAVAPGSNGYFHGLDSGGRGITVETNVTHSSLTLGVMGLKFVPIAGLTIGSADATQTNFVASEFAGGEIGL